MAAADPLSAAALGVMLSPPILVLSVNRTAEGGLLTLLAMLFAAFWYGLAMRNSRMACAALGVPDSIRLEGTVFGPVAAITVNLASRVLAALLLMTTLPVAAGYVFNEMFVYWFPNFGFAFLLLAFLATIQLVSRRLAQRLQLLLTGAAAVGMGGVSLAALYSGSLPTALFLPASFDSLTPLLAGFMALSACDLAPVSTGRRGRGCGSTAALLVAGTLLGLFSVAALSVVPASRLADSTIPHLLVARGALGQGGRLFMGAVVIAGSAAAINGLLLALPVISGEMATALKVPLSARASTRLRRVTVAAACAAAAACMAAGVAGSPRISQYLAAAILMWVLRHGFLQLAIVCLLLARRRGQRPAPGGSVGLWLAAVLALTLFSAVAVAAWNWPLLRETGPWMAAAVGISFALPVVTRRFVRHHSR